MIEAYDFGTMRVMGQTHHHDLKIIENQVIDNWWRRQGHVLSTEDIADVLNAHVETLVIGTGAYGVMKVSPEVTEALSARGIELVSLPTREAVAAFNRLHRQGRHVAGAFHLTC
jgi:hypothetical protein